MRPDSRANRVAFRRAVWASAALHAVAVCALVLFLRAIEKPLHTEKGIDTHAADEPQVRISLSEEAAVRIEEPPSQAVAKPQAADADTQAAKPETSPASPLPSKPFAPTPPRMLPPEMVAIIRKPTTAAGGGDVVEVPVPAGTLNPPVNDPAVRPAGGVPGTPASSPAIHGALAPGKTVVYVLDASGSMGADGKFDSARAALVSTLRQQPATVRFQVIVYAGTALPLLTSDRNGLLASEANVRAASEKLASLEARGLSDHYGAVRAALAFRPDVILMLTDADDLSAAAIKSVLASAPKPVPVCLGQVTAKGVQRPRELK